MEGNLIRTCRRITPQRLEKIHHNESDSKDQSSLLIWLNALKNRSVDKRKTNKFIGYLRRGSCVSKQDSKKQPVYSKGFIPKLHSRTPEKQDTLLGNLVQFTKKEIVRKKGKKPKLYDTQASFFKVKKVSVGIHAFSLETDLEDVQR